MQITKVAMASLVFAIILISFLAGIQAAYHFGHLPTKIETLVVTQTIQKNFSADTITKEIVTVTLYITPQYVNSTGTCSYTGVLTVFPDYTEYTRYIFPNSTNAFLYNVTIHTTSSIETDLSTSTYTVARCPW